SSADELAKLRAAVLSLLPLGEGLGEGVTSPSARPYTPQSAVQHSTAFPPHPRPLPQEGEKGRTFCKTGLVPLHPRPGPRPSQARTLLRPAARRSRTPCTWPRCVRSRLAGHRTSGRASAAAAAS